MLARVPLWSFLIALLLLASGCDSKTDSSSFTTTAQPAASALPATETAARSAYNAKQWSRCAAQYLELARQRVDVADANALYNAACCLALDGRRDGAFATLDRSIAAGMVQIAHIEADPDLIGLHPDPRWSKVRETVRVKIAATEAAEAAVGAPELHRELLAMTAEDQAAREAWIRSNSADDGMRVREIDTKNTARFKEVIAKHGWPGYRLVGKAGANAAWLLAQHADADHDFQKLCLDKLDAAVAAHDASAADRAYLYDRVAVAEHRKQRFGTQFANGEPAPIEDEANVDERRAAIGLPSMADYRKQMEQMYGSGRGNATRR
jgi:hypothetical protein